MLYFFSVLKYNEPIKTKPLLKGPDVMKKMLALMLAILMTLTLFAGCGAKEGSDLAYVKKNGKLIVGITDWGKKFVELEDGNIDCVWNGMTITEEALLNASVSDPYVINAQVIVMKADVVGNYTDTETLKGLTFAVESGSAGEDALIDLGITGFTALQDQTSALMEVKAGTAQACVIDITMANAMTGEGSNYADLAAGISLTSEEYGVAFRKDSDITEKFNKIMADLIADGTLQALADKYQLTLAK